MENVIRKKYGQNTFKNWLRIPITIKHEANKAETCTKTHLSSSGNIDGAFLHKF